jgi:hypothetical protein
LSVIKIRNSPIGNQLADQIIHGRDVAGRDFVQIGKAIIDATNKQRLPDGVSAATCFIFLFDFDVFVPIFLLK